jgi:hypothetical protein
MKAQNNKPPNSNVNSFGKNNVTNNYNASSTTFNFKALELSISKKIEENLDHILWTKLGVKFDAALVEINKSLDKLVEIKIKKCVIDYNAIESSSKTAVNITIEDIEALLDENLEGIIKSALMDFHFLQDVAEIALKLCDNENPHFFSIPQTFDPEVHMFIHHETKIPMTTVTADLLRYFKLSCLNGNKDALKDAIEFYETEIEDNNLFKTRLKLLQSHRDKWLNFLRNIWKHEKICHIVRKGVMIQLKDSISHDGIKVIAQKLSVYTHKLLFGVTKLHCNVVRDSIEELQEFAIPSVLGKIYFINCTIDSNNYMINM